MWVCARATILYAQADHPWPRNFRGLAQLRNVTCMLHTYPVDVVLGDGMCVPPARAERAWAMHPCAGCVRAIVNLNRQLNDARARVAVRPIGWHCAGSMKRSKGDRSDVFGHAQSVLVREADAPWRAIGLHSSRMRSFRRAFSSAGRGFLILSSGLDPTWNAYAVAVQHLARPRFSCGFSFDDPSEFRHRCTDATKSVGSIE